MSKMMEIDIPGRGQFRFENLVLDLNGTIARDGEIIEGVAERLQRLGDWLDISIITADTHGSARSLEKSLPIGIRKIDRGGEPAQKLEIVKGLGAKSTVSIGNGANDVSILRESGLGICVVGPEGAAAEAVAAGDLVVADINTALDLLLNPDRIVATLRL